MPSILLEIGYGTSWGWYKRCLTKVSRIEEKMENSIEVKERLEITVYCLRPKRMLASIHNLFDNIVKTEKKGKNVEIGVNGMGFYSKPYRSIDTMRIKESVKKQIIDHLDKFISSEQEYINSGTPYHTGILFHGSPGTGKSSMTHVIASYLKKGIYMHTKGSLLEAYINPNKDILSLEDVDAAQVSSKKEDRDNKAGNNLSEVLNFLDSFITPHGLVTVATTNRLEVLDPAFVRKGRFDLIINMDEAQL